MKKMIFAALLCIAVFASCIGQEKKEWNVEDWKEHLYFANPGMNQSSAPGMVTGFRNVDDMTPGTRMVFDMEFEGSSMGIDMPMSSTMGFTVAGKEVVDGIETVAVDIDMTMDMEFMGETMTMEITGKEWIDNTGSPVKLEMEAAAEFGGMEIPMTLAGRRSGEEVYQGHDCYIFTLTQTSQMAGVSGGEVEMSMYMDKKTGAVVRMITEAGGQEQDTGYIEPPIETGELQWELGERETITTEMGKYDCQIIYLKEDGKTVATIWANEDIRAPIKYIYSDEVEGSAIRLVMTLLEYSKG